MRKFAAPSKRPLHMLQVPNNEKRGLLGGALGFSKQGLGPGGPWGFLGGALGGSCFSKSLHEAPGRQAVLQTNLESRSRAQRPENFWANA